MLNGSGGYIKINGGILEIGTSGAASFKASMKSWRGGSASGTPPSFPSLGQSVLQLQSKFSQQIKLDESCFDLLDAPPNFNFFAYKSNGSLIHEGLISSDEFQIESLPKALQV